MPAGNHQSTAKMRFGLPGGRGGIEPWAAVRTLELARTAEVLGYDSLWIGEEHFSGPIHKGRNSALVLAGAVAASTMHIGIGFTALFPALHDPIRLAEDLATLDRLSGGRVKLGVGWPNDEYLEAFARATDPAFMQSTLAKVLAYWQRKEVAIGGSMATVTPELIQKPHPPIYVVPHSEDTVVWAAREGHAVILSAFQNDETIGRHLGRFADAGGSVADSPVQRFCFVAESDEAARAAAWPLTVDLCERLRQRALAGQGYQAYKVFREADLEPERFYNETAIIGGPETVARRVAALRDAYGIQYLNLRPSFLGGTPLQQQKTTVQLFATEVIPRLA